MASNQVQDSTTEYAFEEVPENKRMGFTKLTTTVAGYPIALSNFVVGGAIGASSTFSQAILALVMGNLVLMFIVMFLGVLAAKFGLSSSFLARRAFGQFGSRFFSIIVFLVCMIWMAVNGDILARLIGSVFSWWPIPISLTAIIIVFLWLISAMKGHKAIAIVSAIGSPIAIIFAIVGLFAVGYSDGGFQSVFNYVPENPMTFTAATASIIGGWSVGAIVTTDLTRFAKKPQHAAYAGLIAILIGGLGFQFAGAMTAISTGQADFIDAMLYLGLGFVALFTAIFCLWTTEDKDMYAGSLAFQNIIKGTRMSKRIKHKQSTLIFAILGAILAASGIYSLLLPFIEGLSVLVPQVVGIILVEGFIIKKSKHNEFINMSAIIAWIVGGIASFLALKFNFFIPPLLGMIVAGLCFFVLDKSVESTDSAVENISGKVK